MENFVEDDDFETIIGESVKVTEKLNLNPIPRYTEDGRLFVNIGNTGFRYEYRYKKDNEEESNRFDFIPEGRIGEIEERSGKYAMMLCTALTEIRTWLKNLSQVLVWDSNS